MRISYGISDLDNCLCVDESPDRYVFKKILFIVGIHRYNEGFMIQSVKMAETVTQRVIQIVRCILTTSFSDSHQHRHMSCTYRQNIKPTTICMSHSWAFLWKGCKCVWVTSLACKTVLNAGQRPARGRMSELIPPKWSILSLSAPLCCNFIFGRQPGMFGPCLPNLLIARASGTQTPPLSRLLPFIFHFWFSIFFPPHASQTFSLKSIGSRFRSMFLWIAQCVS